MDWEIQKIGSGRKKIGWGQARRQSDFLAESDFLVLVAFCSSGKKSDLKKKSAFQKNRTWGRPEEGDAGTKGGTLANHVNFQFPNGLSSFGSQTVSQHSPPNQISSCNVSLPSHFSTFNFQVSTVRSTFTFQLPIQLSISKVQLSIPHSTYNLQHATPTLTFKSPTQLSTDPPTFNSPFKLQLPTPNSTFNFQLSNPTHMFFSSSGRRHESQGIDIYLYMCINIDICEYMYTYI